jgi:hypothetical protein
MNRRRFVKSAGWGTAGLLLNSVASKSRDDLAQAGSPVIPQTAWGKVYVRWTDTALPFPATLGVRDLVIPWGVGRALIKTARLQGYRVYAGATLDQASMVAEASHGLGISGIVLDSGEAGQKSAEESARHLRLVHPELILLIPDHGGKQPAMKGSTIIKDGGILQVSSPTEQPWIDSNLALVGFDRAFRPTEIPLIDFAWELSDVLQQQQGPSTQDYSLAVAEAGAAHSDLILNLHPNFQKALGNANVDAWDNWKKVVQYLQFYMKGGERPVALQANVGVVTDNYEASYETTNLMVRHNVPFRILPPSDLTPQSLKSFDLIVLFAQPNEAAIRVVASFVDSGGVAILVGLRGPFPWQSNGTRRTNDKSVTYTAGKGKVIELAEGVDDPGTFAQDVRRLLGKEKLSISLWNASTTLVVPYILPGSPTATVELVNYSADPLPVQVRIKGSYSIIRYETPEHGCCEPLTPVCADGFTQFDIPWLRIGGRVHLGAMAVSTRRRVVS